MEQEETFYCISCHTLHLKDRQAHCFRTGFFRIRYPLGICGGCRSALDLPEDPAADQGEREIYRM